MVFQWNYLLFFLFILFFFDIWEGEIRMVGHFIKYLSEAVLHMLRSSFR